MQHEGTSPRQNYNSMESQKYAIIIPEQDTAVSPSYQPAGEASAVAPGGPIVINWQLVTCAAVPSIVVSASGMPSWNAVLARLAAHGDRQHNNVPTWRPCV